jgi:hypothetical protein
VRDSQGARHVNGVLLRFADPIIGPVKHSILSLSHNPFLPHHSPGSVLTTAQTELPPTWRSRSDCSGFERGHIGIETGFELAGRLVRVMSSSYSPREEDVFERPSAELIQ